MQLFLQEDELVSVIIFDPEDVSLDDKVSSGSFGCQILPFICLADDINLYILTIMPHLLATICLPFLITYIIKYEGLCYFCWSIFNSLLQLLPHQMSIQTKIHMC